MHCCSPSILRWVLLRMVCRHPILLHSMLLRVLLHKLLLWWLRRILLLVLHWMRWVCRRRVMLLGWRCHRWWWTSRQRRLRRECIRECIRRRWRCCRRCCRLPNTWLHRLMTHIRLLMLHTGGITRLVPRLRLRRVAMLVLMRLLKRGTSRVAVVLIGSRRRSPPSLMRQHGTFATRLGALHDE